VADEAAVVVVDVPAAVAGIPAERVPAVAGIPAERVRRPALR
jgi:hypothetical protein